MKIVDGYLRLSPTDVANHLACRHLTTLDLALAEGRLKPPEGGAAILAVLQERGLAHEAAYVKHLRSQGLNVVDLLDQPLTGEGVAITRDAMVAGTDAIVQAPLSRDRWAGRADILRRVETPSSLGSWSYEAVDTKLARETRGGTILQLCGYSDILESLQGRIPDHMHVVSPGKPFDERDYRVSDYMAYYRFVRQRLEASVEPGTVDATYPDPTPHCEICRWWATCDSRRHSDDHLSLVAGIRRLQIAEFQQWSINTLEALGTLPLPLPKPERGSAESLTRVREQARVQLEGRQQGRPIHELLTLEPEKGLSRLPAPSPGDVFFDIESDRFSGHQYLFGYAVRDQGDGWTYVPEWGIDLVGEKAVFESFVSFLTKRWEQHPDSHVYHYGSYEVDAMRRLMGKHAVCEDQVDRMLRGGLFVNLHTIVRETIRASVERYSIKDLEPFYDFTRSVPLREASVRLREVEYLLELGQGNSIPTESREAVEQYNKDDCLSAAGLRDWLESLRTEWEKRGQTAPRPAFQAPEPGEKLEERRAEVAALMDRLLSDVPADPAARNSEQRALWLLAQLLDFHRREDKAVWWDFFRLADLDDDDLFDEPAAVAGLKPVARVGGTTKCPIDRYQFPAQEFFARIGSEARAGKDAKIGTLEESNFDDSTVDIKKRADAADVHPPAMFFFKRIDPGSIFTALMRLGEWVAAHGIAAGGLCRAARDLLMEVPPRLRDGASWSVPDESQLERARRLAVALDESVLPIQGPPGSGKTHTGARIVCSLVRAGKKVGVTATSHKVIRNLLNKIEDAASEEGLTIQCVQKPDEPFGDTETIQEVKTNEDVLAALQNGEAQVGGGTAWLWAREEFFESVDALIVDEAGQMSLANVLAAAQAARSLILLGDPQQLEQPLQGSHPEGTAVSVLQHLLGDHQTMPPERGLFLEETWRLAPKICAFTSEMFYEERLRPRAGLANQRLEGPGPLSDAGLRFLPVAHDGNRNHSPEEIEVIARLVDQLIGGEYSWIDAEGEPNKLEYKDILVVASYNAQVYAIRQRLPEARVGTVDRFQGQQAPVVLYSMTTSSVEEAPRGMEFLYSLHRLNVATSRAQCAVVVLASPKLFQPDCQTPRQMQLANAFCSYLERAAVLPA